MKKNIEIICVMCIRNESRNLPGCIEHLYKYVDKFVVFNDNSTDDSVEILSRYDKVVEVITEKQNGKHKWAERHNREVVLRRAFELSDVEKPYVLCVDPDERFEISFLKNLKKIVNCNFGKAVNIHFRELWDNIKQYRSDGIWGNKSKTLLFPLDHAMTFNYENEYHIPWHYREITDIVYLDYNLYHLNMVREEDRIKRRNLYNKLDPEKKYQPIGYDYLTDTNGIVLKKISYRKRYNYKTVDGYYKDYRSEKK